MLSSAALAGCGKREPEAVNVVVIGEDPPALTDAFSGPLSPPRQVAMESLGQGLVRFDPRGEIVPGLAERWNVSDDGLSYIFRLGSAKWPDGRAIRARDVARLLERQLKPGSKNDLKDTLGAVQDIVAMTDRVIEIRLVAPRPHLLQLLAQPEMGILREGRGTGPFTIDESQPDRDWQALSYHKSVIDGPDIREHIRLRSAGAKQAVAMFTAGDAGLVIGGTFSDLPHARQTAAVSKALHFDPVAGLFGLVPLRDSGPFGTVKARQLLSRAIDRQALVEVFDVPGLTPRTTLLQSGLEGIAIVAGEGTPPSDPKAFRAALAAEGRSVFGDKVPTVRVRLPEGPGAELLLQRLKIDWGPLGVRVERAQKGGGADFLLVDAVAPSASAAWFVRRFRCSMGPICVKEADTLMDSARLATVADQRIAFLAEAARLLEEGAAFIPIAAPIRWSLVSDGLPGFVENIRARHPLVGLGTRPSRQGN